MDTDIYGEIDFAANTWEGSTRGGFAAPAAYLTAWRPEEIRPLLARVEALAMAGRWVIGFLAYEAAPAFDPALRVLPAWAGLPLAAFAAFSAPTVPRPRRGFLCGPWRQELSPRGFARALAHIQRGILAGRHYQVNFTAALEARWCGDGAALFDALRASQPGALSLFLNFGRWQIASVSPELFFHWGPDRDGRGRLLTTRPMKGTAPRHLQAARDQAAAAELVGSDKDRAENLMIVDLLRNDLGRVARLGTVAVPRLFAVEPWATVWQMTSTVQCRTRPGLGLPDVFAALFPCGSVTGAPKVEAMRAIVERETSARGVYCGAIGLVRPGGEALFNVGIRTLLLDPVQGRAWCGIGSGVVSDSTVPGERAEWRVKRRFLARACPHYQLLETLLWRRGRYWLRDLHLARLAASADRLGFPWRRAWVEQALDQTAAGFGGGQWRVRLLLGADGRPRLEARPFTPDQGIQRCAVATWPVDSRDPRLQHKTSQRAIYAERRVPGVFDTLLWNERDEATEFTRGNLVVRLDGHLLTPPLASGLLPGTLRAALLARGVLREQPIPLYRLGEARRLWFLNSLRGGVPVVLGDAG